MTPPPSGPTRTLVKLLVAVLLGAAAALATFRMVDHRTPDHHDEPANKADPGPIP